MQCMREAESEIGGGFRDNNVDFSLLFREISY